MRRHLGIEMCLYLGSISQPHQRHGYLPSWLFSSIFSSKLLMTTSLPVTYCFAFENLLQIFANFWLSIPGCMLSQHVPVSLFSQYGQKIMTVCFWCLLSLVNNITSYISETSSNFKMVSMLVYQETQWAGFNFRNCLVTKEISGKGGREWPRVMMLHDLTQRQGETSMNVSRTWRAKISRDMFLGANPTS